MTTDYRDHVIAHLADSEAELLERVGLTETYREMAKAAIDQLAEQNDELEYLRRRVAALVDENRSLREPVAA